MSESTKYRSITVRPAYGRDYRSEPAVRQAWADGKDFIIMSADGVLTGGSYVNNRDVANFTPEAEVRIRYARGSKVVVI